ncbi:Core-2/I-Branching enzyme [Musa troglodytarum]|uniref:Core-2/I-Branching enzyme n=1 Tax=Musa troglodytarum TaxID=320322 RepID=A0A9E7JWM1_9LILI|nr:Core-2/I-Branching enzyme [Musa troglodytarum]
MHLHPRPDEILSVVGLLQDEVDPMVSVMKVEKAPLESYADIGGLDASQGSLLYGSLELGKLYLPREETLANALQDPDNQHFVLLSDSCVPMHNFDYDYNYLTRTNVSFIDCFWDPGPNGNARYIDHMLPKIEAKDFRKGSQWFSMKRRHALIVLADNLYYTKFKLYCKVNTYLLILL